MTTTIESTSIAAVSLAHLSDRELLDTTSRVASDERRTTVELIALLAEVEERRLYLGVGCASMFVYCRQALRLSEHEAYNRIEAARAARRFPVVLEMLRDGSITQTTVRLLRPHLTAENHAEVFRAARHKSKHEVEMQVAAFAPRNDSRTVVRRLPSEAMEGVLLDLGKMQLELPDANTAPMQAPISVPLERPPVKSIPLVRPIASARYVIKVTVSAEAHARLRRAQNLLQHKIPGADAAEVIDAALALLVDRLERAKVAKVQRPRRLPGNTPAQNNDMQPGRGRHIPAAIKREVWARDEGRCAFEGTGGRCRETGRLEFHHIVPFADGGETDTANLSLRCRAHNRFERDRWFGP